MKKKCNDKVYYVVAFWGCVLLPLFSLLSYTLMRILFYQFGNNPAIAVLQGEFWGKWFQAFLLIATPVLILLCFLAEQLTLKYRQHMVENQEGSELLSSAQQRDFYLQQRETKQKKLNATPWFHYFFLFGVSILFFVFGVIRPQLSTQIAVLKEDIITYQANEQLTYSGPLLLVERPVVNGILAIPDERFFYYRSDAGYLRCAVPLLAQSEMMQLGYTVTYLPNTGTVLSILDANGNVRTNGAEAVISVPDGYWLYGDLLVPICEDVDGYSSLTFDEQKLFDILYAQALNNKTGEPEAPTRSFHLPYPLKQEQFNKVLALYMESESYREYPMYKYRTDDGRIVRVAYCQRIAAK